MQEEIYRMQTGGAHPHIHPSDLKPIKICLPKLNEQESIAQIIREMDIEIKVNIDKCEKIKLNKQGMMQELLTGKTRLI
jgi:type I restriction enzyme S subunit